MASLIAASIVGIIVSLVMFFVIGISFGVLTFALWFYALFRLIPKLSY